MSLSICAGDIYPQIALIFALSLAMDDANTNSLCLSEEAIRFLSDRLDIDFSFVVKQ